MVLYGLELHSFLVLNGLPWAFRVLYGPVLFKRILNDMVLYSMVLYGMVLYGMVLYCSLLVLCGLVQIFKIMPCIFVPGST